jgi:hypothetical protein
LSFDGSDDYVEIPNTTSANFTLEAWIKPNGTATNEGANTYRGDGLLWSDISGNANDFVLAVQGDNLSFWEGSANANLTGNSILTDGNWHHIAVSRQANGPMILYVDGKQDGFASAGSGTLTANPLIHIGANTDSSRYYSGQIDEVRIWNTVRTKTEIEDNMNTSLSASESGLTAYYTFDEISLPVTDDSGNGNDGTINNGRHQARWQASTR